MFNKIIDYMTKVSIGAEFGIDECYCDEDYDMICWARKTFDELGSMSIFHGVSKLVLVLDNYDKVIKLPFSGWWVNEVFEDFYYNYCNLEVRNYGMLCDEGLEMFAAEVHLLCHTKDGTPVYTQEKVTPYEMCHNNDNCKPSEESYTKARSNSEYCSRLCSDWVAKAIDCYGEELTKKFIHYITEENRSIGADLHTGNYGYRADGSPCLLDFSDFCDN